MKKPICGAILGAISILGVNSASALTPTDSLYPQQWYLHSTGFGPFALPPMKIDSAWNLTTGHAYVGVIDSVLSYDLLGGDPISTTNGVDLNSNGLTELLRSRRQRMELFGNLSGGNYNQHALHVSGIIAASANDNFSPSSVGVCWDCSLISTSEEAEVRTGTHYLVSQGAQVINLSAGFSELRSVEGDFCESGEGMDNDRCQQFRLAESRDVIFVAASGNNASASKIDFPASHPYVISVGASNKLYAPATFSNFSSELDVFAPGTNIMSPIGGQWTNLCGDNYTVQQYPFEFSSDSPGSTIAPSPLGAIDGYGVCTGTSMAAPIITGVVALMRSIDPLLKADNVKDALFSSGQYYSGYTDTSNGRIFSGKSPLYAHGSPNAYQALSNVLGESGGTLLKNRLTPLFNLYSEKHDNSFYTSVPQMARSAMSDTLFKTLMTEEAAGSGFSTYLPLSPLKSSVIVSYSEFPSAPEDANSSLAPTADVYVFTTKHNPLNPNEPLVPLYRLSYEGMPLNLDTCVAKYRGDEIGEPRFNTDHTYTTDQDGLDYFTSETIFSYQAPPPSNSKIEEINNYLQRGSDPVPMPADFSCYSAVDVYDNQINDYISVYAGTRKFTFNYQFDGIEGYIFSRDFPQPQGSVKLYRYYNSTLDDHAIFPESKLTEMVNKGYGPLSTGSSGYVANDFIGYVYPNVDQDNDGLIDGFELVLGTGVNNPDSDSDGKSDGQEVNGYPRTDPLVNSGGGGCGAGCNTSPQFTSHNGAQNVSLSFVEGIQAITTVSANDSDQGDVLTYSLSGVDASQVTFDAQTGAVGFATTPDFENPADQDGDNAYTFAIQVSDMFGATATQSFSVSITNDPSDDSVSACGTTPSNVVIGSAFPILATNGKLTINPLQSVLARPFATTSSNQLSGLLTINKLSGQNISRKMWISECPGGAEVSSSFNSCIVNVANSGSIDWSQKDNPQFNHCKLELNTQYYLNFEAVGCNSSNCGSDVHRWVFGS